MKEINEDKEQTTPRDKATFILSITILLACIFTNLFVVQFTHVESGSMEPTIMTGDYTVVNKIAYVREGPQRGDIVAFKSKELGVYLLKRVIGLPGDEIEFHNGSVYINGQVYDESAYLEEGVETFCEKFFSVPEDSYFMMGDEREHSADSRVFKSPYISKKDIIGKVAWYFSF